MIENNFKVDPSSIVSKRNRLVNPWITGAIITSVQTKIYFYKEWKKTCDENNPLGSLEFYERYKEYRKVLRQSIKNAKKLYYSKRFNIAAGNIKKTWKLINELRGKSKANIKASFIIDGNMVTDRREIADGFNTFFSSIAEKMNAKVASSTLSHVNSSDENNFRKFLSSPKIPKIRDSIFLSHCDETELIDIMKEFDNNKASDININVLKSISKLIVGHLVNFFNKFLDIGIFPTILKSGMITPIFKKGDSRYFDNYRPVSTLPVFGKILEKLMYNRLYSFLSSKNIIFRNQFGFRKKHSTSHAVNYSVDKVITEIEKKKHVIGIFIDLSKAFDTIEHGILLDKLEHYGIRGKLHTLIKSYISCRTQQTKILGMSSDKCFVKYGVPQGSVLGPLLFLIYINDIVSSTTLGEFILFADDTNIFIVDENEKTAYEKANKVLAGVNEYMKSNQLHINVGKSCYMHFKPTLDRVKQTCARIRCFDTNLNIKLNGTKLSKVKSTKFLGVVIDDQLTWEPQVEYLKAKLISSIVTIKRIKPFIPKTEYEKVYNALFMSHLSYCISCWGGIPNYKLGKIFSIQKRCVRLLFGKEVSYDRPEFYFTCARIRTYNQHMEHKSYCLEHTKPLFNEHKILNLENLYFYHMFMEIFKILKYSIPCSLKQLFNLCPRNQKFLLMTPKVKLEVSKQNFVFKATKVWNKLIGHALERTEPEISGLIIPGSARNSDLSASIAFVKGKIKIYIQNSQKLGHIYLW